MVEEVRRVTQGLPAHERGAFLAALEQLFPKWEQTVVVDAGGKGDGKLPREPVAAATLLLSLLSPNPDDPHRRQVVAMLENAGVVTRPAADGFAGWPEDRVVKLREKLGLETSVQLDAARVLDALQLLTEFAENLEQFAYAACRQAAPDHTSKLKRGDLKKVLNEFLSNSQDTARGQIAIVIQRIKTSASAIVSAPPKVWEQIPERLGHLSPAEIQQRVDAEATTAQKVLGIEKAYWKKFVQLSADLREDALQDMVRETVRKYIEPIINER